MLCNYIQIVSGARSEHCRVQPSIAEYRRAPECAESAESRRVPRVQSRASAERRARERRVRFAPIRNKRYGDVLMLSST